MNARNNSADKRHADWHHADWRHAAAAVLLLLIIIGALWRRAQSVPEITSTAPAGAAARMQDPP